MMIKLIPGGKAMTSSNHFRSSPPAAHVRVLCISEPDRALNPLELQEDFVEICRSDFVEIYEKGEIDVRFGGNVIQVILIENKMILQRIRRNFNGNTCKPKGYPRPLQYSGKNWVFLRLLLKFVKQFFTLFCHLWSEPLFPHFDFIVIFMDPFFVIGICSGPY